MSERAKEILERAREAFGNNHYGMASLCVDEALAALDAEGVGLPLDPTPEMVEAGAARLMSYEEGSTWPDSFTPIQQRAARNDAEKVWRSMVLAIPLPGQSGAKGSAGLREAVRDVLDGTPLDRHGNRNDDGMRMHLTMGGTAPVREWFERLDAALRAGEEQSHE